MTARNPKPLPNMELTIAIYCMICRYIEETGIPPTQREIARECFVSNGSVLRHLDRLQMWGYIQRVEGASRNIVLTGVAPFRCDDG
jgi:SOS-response transcriptional repressor LexA